MRDYLLCMFRRMLGKLAKSGVLMLTTVMGVQAMQAQSSDPEEGTWYITNNNYYLYPGINSYYDDAKDQPHLTTYKTGAVKGSAWRIVKANDDGDYYIIHNATGKYLTANDAKTSDARQLRVHLELADSPTDKMLFKFEKSGTNYAIYPMAYTTEADYYLNAYSGNKDSYVPDGNTVANGMIGFNAKTLNNATKWTLKAAGDICADPIVEYADGQFTITYPIAADGATIHYTTDGSEPTAESPTYSGTIPETGVTLVRAIAVKEGYANSTVAELYAPNQSYLVKNMGTTTGSFYMIAPRDDTYQYVTTSNVPSQYLEWQLKPAGLHSGIQYYYFYNPATGKYLYRNANANSANAIVMKALGDGEAERFIFRLYTTDDYINIVPIGLDNNLPNSLQNNLFKQNGNDKNNPLGLYKDNANGNPRWQFIPVPDVPSTLFTCTMASTESDRIYFKIKGATADKTYCIIPPATPNGSKNGYATASNVAANTSADNAVWYLEEATDEDTWATYYYLRNAATGQYFYFDGVAKNDNDNKFFVSNSINAGNEDKYKFVVVKTANTTYAGTYNIIPKAIKDYPNQVKIALNRNNNTLRTIDSRDNGNNCWYLDAEGVYTVAPPIINYVIGDNAIAMTCTMPGVTIYYTTDGTDPTTGSTEYNGEFSLPDDASTIKAISVKDGVSSNVAMRIPVRVSDATNKRIFYIQSQHSTRFYLIPGPTSSGNVMVNTLSLPRPAMQWYALDAGIENDVQYYYIVNNHADNDATTNTLGYLYCNGNSANIKSELNASDDNYKFAILEHKTNGEFNGFYIMAKTKLTADATANGLCKGGSGNNNANDNVSTNGNSANVWVRWNIVTEQPTQHIGFTVSTAEQKAIYSISNVGQTGYITPPTETYVTMASNESDDRAWYFLEAARDEWVTYYYIVHAITGKYLYFGGSTTSLREEERMMLKEKTADNEDLYQFAIANPVEDDQYYIIPKVHKYAYNYQYYLLYKVDNAFILKTNASRADNRFKWAMVEYAYKCDVPKFNYTSGSREVVITCSTPGSTIYYSLGDNEPTISDASKYTGSFTLPEGITSIKAFAILDNDDTYKSEMAKFSITPISSGSEITNMSDYYYLAEEFVPSDTPIGTASNPFRGTIDGQFHTISGLSHPLIAYAENATIRNVIIDNVDISSGTADGNVGAICCEATGQCRIYNCGVLGGTISGTNYVGGLVGKLDDYSRVINCFSFADITDGAEVAGIVGYNSISSTQDNIRTMVMNCMMYGDITGGTKVYPVYGGKLIRNDQNNGINNYNYYRDGMQFGSMTTPTDYYCSWPAEVPKLTRFEYYRHLLNCNRELCAWWISGDYRGKAIVAKWVLDTEVKPYPILKPWGRYPSVVNRDPKYVWHNGNKISRTDANEYEGKTLDTLTVTVNPGLHGTASKKTLYLPVTDMDTLRFDYGYAKVQLPYYNTTFGNPATGDYAGNYTDGNVVTGWKVTAVSGGTSGTYSSTRTKINNFWVAADGAYNFADRKCTEKDKYSVSGRVFAQGGYYYVPEGVTAITIEPYWGKAVYLQNYEDYVDRVNFIVAAAGTIAQPFAPTGKRPDTFRGQTVYNSLPTAIEQIPTTGSVYDNAIVLVGNVQHFNGTSDNFCKGGKHRFTVMSVDLDFDDEPDYNLELEMGNGSNRANLAPVRFDFVDVCDLGIAVQRYNTTLRYAIACLYTYGHFEVTETSQMTSTEINYDEADRKSANEENPMILNAGQWPEEFVCSNTGFNQSDKIRYVIAGGNATFKVLSLSTHNTQAVKCHHSPISIMGGEFETVSLTGLVKSLNVNQVYKDNPQLYTNGGRFGTIQGAGMEAVAGDVYFHIDHSIIDEFYGGGSHNVNIITGNISIEINNSRVGKYCGGPKVGSMATGKTITTRATNTIFGQYYGAGNGGTAYSLNNNNKDDAGKNKTAVAGSNPPSGNAADWWMSDSWYKPLEQFKSEPGFQAMYRYQIWSMPSGTIANHPSRGYTYSAQFATTTTHDVTNILTGCTFLGDFYGAGNLGAVDGNVTSTLTDCTVYRSAFGAGYSASIPSFDVMTTEGLLYPYRDGKTGVCYQAVYGKTYRYTWTNTEETTPISSASDAEDAVNWLNTDIPLTNLGTVTGKCSITIDGTSRVEGSVFGGGNESAVDGDTDVILSDDTEVMGNVYGGGRMGNVLGNSKVDIN